MGITVTVGICAKNSEKTLPAALESLNYQNFPHKNMEVILVDDGSTDQTPIIMQKYASETDISVKLHIRDWSGLGPSRNLIVKEASGKYVIWLDADMVLPFDHVQKQVSFMEAHPKVGMAKARYANHPSENLVGFLENVAYMAVDFKYGGITQKTLGTGGSVYRYGAIKEVGGFDEKISGSGEDVDVEYRMRKNGWLSFLGTNAAFYERRRNNWISLWHEGYWHGHNVHKIYKKNSRVLFLPAISPFGGFVAGIYYSLIFYKFQPNKKALLLPFQYTFKRIAWFLGFLSGQMHDSMR